MTDKGDTSSVQERELRSLQGFYTRQIERTVEMLRRLAEEIEHEGKPTSSYVNAATYIMGAVHNTLPNLPLGLLVQAGRDVDAWKVENGGSIPGVER